MSAAAIKKPSDWTQFMRLAAKEGAVCYGRAPTPATIRERLDLKVRCIVWVSSGYYRYYAFRDRQQLDDFIATVCGSTETEL